MEKKVYSEHPPLREFKISHDDNSITASPFKIKPNNEIEAKDFRNIMYQNNFANQYLGTIGEQLDMIEDLVQSNPITKILNTKTDDKPIFKIQELTPNLLKEQANQNQEFLKLICKKLENLEPRQTIVPGNALIVINNDKQNNEIFDSIQNMEWKNPQNSIILEPHFLT